MNWLIAAAFVSFSILICYSVAGAQADPAGFTAVPASMLDGSSLVLKNANVSFVAPAPDWRWLEPITNKGRNYMCFNPKTGGGATISVGELVNDLDELTRKEITDAVRAGSMKAGNKVANEKLEAAQIPVPGHSWRYTFEATRGDGKKLYTILYFARTGEKSLITIQGFSIDGNDTPTFNKFVSSVKLLQEFTPKK
ncbi:MAG TPA: hypothetical protein VEK08_18920 [Planctomycetota bacterium]|nr:hypothetical protein [Planctomycetota bacterium]